MTFKKTGVSLIFVLALIPGISNADEVEVIQAGIKKCYGVQGINNALIYECHDKASKQFVSLIESRIAKIESLLSLVKSKRPFMSLSISEVKRFKASSEEVVELECKIFGYGFEPGVPICLSEGYGKLAKKLGLLELQVKSLAE